MLVLMQTWSTALGAAVCAGAAIKLFGWDLMKPDSTTHAPISMATTQRGFWHTSKFTCSCCTTAGPEAHPIVIPVAHLTGSEPVLLPLQDIRTWPTLRFSQIPWLPEFLGLPNLSSLEFFISRRGFWTSNLDFATVVKTDDRA